MNNAKNTDPVRIKSVRKKDSDENIGVEFTGVVFRSEDIPKNIRFAHKGVKVRGIVKGGRFTAQAIESTRVGQFTARARMAKKAKVLFPTSDDEDVQERKINRVLDRADIALENSTGALKIANKHLAAMKKIANRVLQAD